MHSEFQIGASHPIQPAEKQPRANIITCSTARGPYRLQATYCVHAANAIAAARQLGTAYRRGVVRPGASSLLALWVQGFFFFLGVLLCKSSGHSKSGSFRHDM